MKTAGFGHAGPVSLVDSIFSMMLEEKVVQQVIHAQQPIAVQNDGIICHFEKSFLR